MQKIKLKVKCDLNLFDKNEIAINLLQHAQNFG